LNDPIPNFVFTRLRKDDGARYFGPFADGGALRNTLALVRRQFNLRGCRVFTPGAADYKHCLYAHLKYCTAPCIGNVTRDQYLEQALAACDFLEGQCQEMKARLDLDMRQAAMAREYEKAADLRDLLRDLERTTQKTERFERVPYSLRWLSSRRRICGNWPACLAWRAAATYRGIRHLEHQRHAGRGVAGEFQKRPARPRQLPAVQNENGRGPG